MGLIIIRTPNTSFLMSQMPLFLLRGPVFGFQRLKAEKIVKFLDVTTFEPLQKGVGDKLRDLDPHKTMTHLLISGKNKFTVPKRGSY